MTDYLDWPGQSGAAYRYWFVTLDAKKLLDVGGNYIFVKQLPNGNWLPVYIGQADDLQGRLPNHDRLEDAKKAGVTHVMAHTTPAGEAARLAEERDLIQRWHPPLNTQHRKAS